MLNIWCRSKSTGKKLRWMESVSKSKEYRGLKGWGGALSSYGLVPEKV